MCPPAHRMEGNTVDSDRFDGLCLAQDLRSQGPSRGGRPCSVWLVPLLGGIFFAYLGRAGSERRPVQERRQPVCASGMAFNVAAINTDLLTQFSGLAPLVGRTQPKKNTENLNVRNRSNTCVGSFCVCPCWPLSPPDADAGSACAACLQRLGRNCTDWGPDIGSVLPQQSPVPASPRRVPLGPACC